MDQLFARKLLNIFIGWTLLVLAILDAAGAIAMDTAVFNCTYEMNDQCSQCLPGTFENSSVPQCSCCQQPGYCLFLNGSRALVHREVLVVALSSFCTPCKKGGYQPDHGASACLSCPVGQFASQEGSNNCSLCNAGQYGNQTGASNCTKCPTGTCQPERGQPQCDDCGAGTETRGEGSRSCNPCPRGFAKLNAGRQPCDPCMPGSYSSAVGATNCSLCLAGSFQSHPQAVGCQDCGAGSFCPTDGCKLCSPCWAGQESPHSGSTNCSLCQKGYFKRTTSFELCQTCEDGYIALKEGQTQCELCQAGYYCPCPSCTPRPCPDHTVCPAGSSSPQTCEPPWHVISSHEQCHLSTQFKAVVGGIIGGLLVLGLLAFLWHRYERTRLLPLTQETTPLLHKEGEDGQGGGEAGPTPRRRQEPVYSGL